MLKHRGWAFGLVLAGIIVLTGVLAWRDAEGKKMSEVKFELGKNIVETAKASGVPEFSARKVASTVSYSVNGIPREIPVRYAKPGYETTWQPVFAFTMYAHSSTMAVDTAVLQLNIDDMTDAQALAFVESTIAQFQKGKWQRYWDPAWQTGLTGRSSYLDEHGNIQSIPMTVDPTFAIPYEDWLVLARNGVSWSWVGDGVLAKLTVDNSPGEDDKPAYRMSLEFELLAVKLTRDADNLTRDLKEGDAKGWGSTAQHVADKAKRTAQLRAREANAIKRGDAVVPFPQTD